MFSPVPTDDPPPPESFRCPVCGADILAVYRNQGGREGTRLVCSADPFGHTIPRTGFARTGTINLAPVRQPMARLSRSWHAWEKRYLAQCSIRTTEAEDGRPMIEAVMSSELPKRPKRRNRAAKLNGHAAAYADYVALMKGAGITPRSPEAWLAHRTAVQNRS